MDDIFNSLLAAIDDKYDKTEGYIVYDLLKSVALVISQLDEEQKEAEELLDVDHLSGELLAKFIFQRTGIVRTAATNSIGQVTVTGNGTVTIGDLFETPDGIQFSAQETKTIAGSGSVNVKCTVAGAVGNVVINSITQMPVTISGITSVTNPNPTHDGFDAESDESLRNRYYTYLRTPATSGNKWHYYQWAKSISGVGDAKVFPLGSGDNTVDVVIIDQDKQPASPDLVAEVQEYIDPNSTGEGNGEAPIGAKCYVSSAEGLVINISLSVTREAGYSDDSIINNIKGSITTYLEGIAFASEYVSYAKVTEAILNSDGVIDCSSLLINSATANIPIGSRQVAIMGGVTLA
ncbi:baseplate J/gp47 family protein [Paenibacillus thailandensis]|uniref:Baseplate J/gp47 family protein n=1 Tax=Paenibacillus thailandensis TaxID=393250 RepID=A0ABW5R2U8_9BACL